MPSYTPGAMTVFDGSESIWRRRLPPEMGVDVWPFIVANSVLFLTYGRCNVLKSNLEGANVSDIAIPYPKES